jgi:hypothetical protein
MAFDMGFGFRSTAGYVTDPAYQVAAPYYAYPHTFTNDNGDSLNAGWTEFCSTLDVSQAVDPRLAGFAYHSGPRTFQIDLASGSNPGAGTYTVDLAVGSAVSAQTIDAFAVKDNTTSVISLSGSLASGHFFDATGTDRAPGTDSWDLVRATVSQAFASTTVKLVGGTGVNYFTLAHFRLTPQGGGGSFSAAITATGTVTTMLLTQAHYASTVSATVATIRETLAHFTATSTGTVGTARTTLTQVALTAAGVPAFLTHTAVTYAISATGTVTSAAAYITHLVFALTATGTAAVATAYTAFVAPVLPMVSRVGQAWLALARRYGRRR